MPPSPCPECTLRPLALEQPPSIVVCLGGLATCAGSVFIINSERETHTEAEIEIETGKEGEEKQRGGRGERERERLVSFC